MFPWVQLGAAVLGGLFAPKPKYDENQKMMMGVAHQFQNFGNSAPFSDPQEASALAQQRGLLGEEQRNQQQQLLSMFNPNQLGGSLGDFAKNYSSDQMMQRSMLDAQALMNSLQQRRQSLLQASNIAGGIGPRQQQPQTDLGQGLGQLAGTYAQYQGQQQGNQDIMKLLRMFQQAQQQGGGGAPGPSYGGGFMGMPFSR